MGGFYERAFGAMWSGSDAGSSQHDEDGHSDSAVDIDSESQPDLLDESDSDDSCSDDSTTDFGELDRESKTSTSAAADDDDASLWVHPGSVAGDVYTIDSDDNDVHPIEQMARRRQTQQPIEQMAKRRKTTATAAASTSGASTAGAAPSISEARCRDPPTRRLRDKTIPETGLSPGEIYVLKCFRVPGLWWHILAMLHWHGRAGASTSGASWSMGDIGGCEYYAGQAEVTKALCRRGYDVYAYDIKYLSDLMDMCNPLGFLYAIVLCLRVRSHGICWFGTVCSSWVWIAKATTMRTLSRPRGDTRVPVVVEGNMQCTRSCLLMTMCYVRQIVWILEQPSSSRIFTHPAMVWARERAHEVGREFHIISTYQGAFGAETPKKTILASNSKCTHGLVRSSPEMLSTAPLATARVTSVRADGRRMITGTSALKGTQAYSAEFGEAVAETYSDESYFDSLLPGDSGIIGLQEVTLEDAWSDAALEGVASSLRDASPRLLKRLATLHTCR